MCGLVGIASSNLLASDKSVFKTLLYLDQIRGAHSTGVCAVDDKSGAHVYKRALAASDFIQLRGYADTVAKGNRVLIGHNRYATLGAKDDNNAHPFSHGGVTLVHNGTLVNKGELLEKDDRVVFPTDSETITYALSLYDWQPVLESLEGAYALVWYDSRDNTLNFARNEERPLWLGVMGGDLVWASERSMLELTASNEKLALKDLVQLPIGKLFCYDVGDLSAAPVEADFTPKKRKPTYQRGGADWRSTTTTSFRERK